MKTYRLSPTGRRTSVVLLIGALIIWAFAIWSFRSTLNISYNPLQFWPSLSATIADGLTISQVVPALLMLVLIVATPLLIWNLLEEWAATYTVTSEGLRFASLGIQVMYPWAAISAVHRSDDDGDEPLDELVVTGDPSRQISNPVLRFLHTQGYGRNRLPIYAGLEARDELITEIRQRAGLLNTPEEQAAPATV